MEELRKLLDELPGEIGLYYKDLTSGKEFCYNEDVQFVAASVMKLPLMMDVYRRVEAGEMSLCDKLRMNDFNKVPGCGAIQWIQEDISLSLRTLIALMITISDNTATNILIEHIGIPKLKEGFKTLGLEKTIVNRLLFDTRGIAEGTRNYITPKEIGGLLETLYKGEFISKEKSEEMIEILKAQQIYHKIPDSLPQSTVVAHKTGESTGITHDAGIIFSDKPFIFVFTSFETDTSKANATLRKAARICYDLSMEG